MNPPYYLFEEGQVTGPHSLEVLRQKAEIHVIGPDTPTLPATLPVASWRPLSAETELHALLFPTRPALSLGKAQFTPANSAGDATTAPVDVFALLRENAAIQNAAERTTPLPALSRRGKNRNRDFLIVVVGGDALALLLWLWTGQNSVYAIFILAFMVILTLTIYWVLYHVLDPY